MNALAEAKAWPFVEARKILQRIAKTGATSVVFETGYGPSGLPHIGTFGEVVRTNMVRHALSLLAPDTPSRLICFSDDMDGMRKVPPNLPQQEMLAKHIDKPLSAVPDPYGKYESFSAHNNARLCAFLDSFGFDYEFASATDYYRHGKFDATLLKILARFDDVMEIILPTLGAERRETYSPFLPICPQSGRVLMVETKVESAPDGIISYTHPDNGKRVETPVIGGACKLQWKADWAMRWAALGVDYEMAGKDLDESVTLSTRICAAIGANSPATFSYELFLDANGEKISKTKGNGITIEEWLKYAPQESLALYMFQSPRKAKRLHFDVIPKATDDYIAHATKYDAQDTETRLANPAYHIHEGAPPAIQMGGLSFALLLNLVGASNASDNETLWGFIQKHAPDTTPQNAPFLDRLVEHAILYYQDFVRPHKTYRAPTDTERVALQELADRLETFVDIEGGGIDNDAENAEAIQNIVYEIGRAHFADNMRGWFGALYEVLLGQSQGPRFGSFVALYGRARTIALIRDALDRKLGEGDQ